MRVIAWKRTWHLEPHRGHEVDTQGDAFFLVFPAAIDALDFAAGLQRRLATDPWPEGVELRLRITRSWLVVSHTVTPVEFPAAALLQARTTERSSCTT